MDDCGREFGEKLVRLDRFLQSLVEKLRRFVEPKLARPGLERAIGSDLVLLDGLRGCGETGVKRSAP